MRSLVLAIVAVIATTASAQQKICVDGRCYIVPTTPGVSVQTPRTTVRVQSQPSTIRYYVPQAMLQVACPQCGRVHMPRSGPAVSAPVSRGQQIAQSRADYMARTGMRGHPPRSAGNFAEVGGFEGVGWTSRRNAAKNTIGTCRPSGPSGAADDNSTRLVGDAVAYGPGGSYRVRIWERSTGRHGPVSRLRLFRR